MFDKAITTKTVKRFDINNKSSVRHIHAKKHIVLAGMSLNMKVQINIVGGHIHN